MKVQKLRAWKYHANLQYKQTISFNLSFVTCTYYCLYFIWKYYLDHTSDIVVATIFHTGNHSSFQSRASHGLLFPSVAFTITQKIS